RTEQPNRFFIEMPAGAAARRFLHRAGVHPFREIGASAKRAALGRQHDGAASWVRIEPLEGLADLGDQRAVEEIMRRPPHLDRRHHAVEADADFLEPAVVGHCSLLYPTTRGEGHEEITAGTTGLSIL